MTSGKERAPQPCHNIFSPTSHAKKNPTFELKPIYCTFPNVQWTCQLNNMMDKWLHIHGHPKSSQCQIKKHQHGHEFVVECVCVSSQPH